MNEADWMSCSNPTPMLEYLRTQRTASERKLRLFAAACCRRRWDWLGEKSRNAVEVLERYVDGLATDDQLRIAARGAAEDWSDCFGTHNPSNAAYCAVTFKNVSHHDAAHGAAAAMAEGVRCEASVSKGISLHGWPPPPVPLIDPAVGQACIEAGDEAMAAERSAQCHLLRETFHGPCRAVYFRSQWRAGTVRRLASAIYEERRFDDMPILADALEDAGCADDSIIRHCREQGGGHVRGCWVLDLLLGKA